MLLIHAQLNRPLEMTTSTVLSHLRRRYRHLPSLSSSYTTLSQYHPITSRHLTTSPTPHHRQSYPQPPFLNSLVTFSHAYSTRSDDSEIESDALNHDLLETEALVDQVLSAGGGDESIFPIRVMISLLDGYHDFTGWPWWVIVSSSTLALRIALLPLLVGQQRKLKTIAELFPKLPSPLPPLFSGRSYIKQLSLFRKERRKTGCPSYLWFIATISVQIPCFLLWMSSIRRMSLDSHPGFDCGGMLWFQNLTEVPHGAVGLIFPFFISSLHLINVQISFLGTSVAKDTGIMGQLAKYYKIYLRLLTMPIFLTGVCIPQGSLVYWLTNSSLTMIQQLFLRHPVVQEKLGLQLPVKATASVVAASSEKLNTLETRLLDPPTEQRKVPINKLSPQELLAVSVKYLSEGHNDKAIPLLRLALEKDPDYVRAMIIMGQISLQKGLLAEAIEYLERAISKLYLTRNITEAEYCDLLMLASQWAGVAYIRQNKQAEGIVHLERVAGMEEPTDLKSKPHYFEGLLLLSSALSNNGRKEEAKKHLRRAAAYEPSYIKYLEECEKDDEDFADDLVNSRRRDY